MGLQVFIPFFFAYIRDTYKDDTKVSCKTRAPSQLDVMARLTEEPSVFTVEQVMKIGELWEQK